MVTPVLPNPLVLASASPRRRELLERLGLRFTLRPADLDESVHPGEAAHRYVERVAKAKAAWVAGQVSPPTLVLAADTSVVADGAVLGKPTSDADAERMLRLLSGKAHQVLTGVALDGAYAAYVTVSTTVHFAPLSDAQIRWYVRTGEPHDKAGAYAIQGLAGAFVRAVEGSVSNVVGLPLAETLELLSAAGVPLPWSAP